jgi:hypothetical protein
MPNLAKKTRIRIEVSSGGKHLITRDVEVRSLGEVEVNVADTLRQYRLNEYTQEPAWNLYIKITKLGHARNVFELRTASRTA